MSYTKMCHDMLKLSKMNQLPYFTFLMSVSTGNKNHTIIIRLILGSQLYSRVTCGQLSSGLTVENFCRLCGQHWPGLLARGTGI